MAQIKNYLSGESHSEMPKPLDAQYSYKEQKTLLEDLRLVGQDKPVGYLPIKTLIEVCYVRPEDMQRELEAKGLVVLRLSEKESNVSGGALYAYDRTALAKILDSNKTVLEKNKWPTDPDKFVRHLRVTAKDPDLYRIIMQVFADPRLNREQKGLTSDTYYTYGKKNTGI